MIDPGSVLDKEIESLEVELQNGCLSQEEFDEAVKDLERDYHNEARESAQRAHDDELERWR